MPLLSPSQLQAMQGLLRGIHLATEGVVYRLPRDTVVAAERIASEVAPLMPSDTRSVVLMGEGVRPECLAVTPDGSRLAGFLFRFEGARDSANLVLADNEAQPRTIPTLMRAADAPQMLGLLRLVGGEVVEEPYVIGTTLLREPSQGGLLTGRPGRAPYFAVYIHPGEIRFGR